MYNKINNGNIFKNTLTVMSSEPFHSAMPNGHSHGADVKPGASVSPLFEEWFHGNLSRKEVGVK